MGHQVCLTIQGCGGELNSGLHAYTASMSYTESSCFPEALLSISEDNRQGRRNEESKTQECRSHKLHLAFMLKDRALAPHSIARELVFLFRISVRYDGKCRNHSSGLRLS